MDECFDSSRNKSKISVKSDLQEAHERYDVCNCVPSCSWAFITPAIWLLSDFVRLMPILDKKIGLLNRVGVKFEPALNLGQ